MGYPNKRVPMTDVHGEPQQGGYLPAEIWHAYMAAVTEGQPCVPNSPRPSEPISYQPFFGKFASTGRTSRDSHGESAKTPSRASPRQRTTSRSAHGEAAEPAEPAAPGAEPTAKRRAAGAPRGAGGRRTTPPAHRRRRHAAARTGARGARR